MSLFGCHELELEVILAFPERSIQKGSWKWGLVVGSMELQRRKGYIFVIDQ